MKKLLLLILCTTTLGLVSCKKDTIIQEVPQNRTFIYTVQPNEWVLSGDGVTYTADLDIPEIDQVSIDDEGTLVYIANPNTANTYRQLPYVFDVDAYSYEMYDGGILIDIQTSDEQVVTPRRPINAVKVKVVLIPSRFVP